MKQARKQEEKPKERNFKTEKCLPLPFMERIKQQTKTMPKTVN